MFSNLIRERDTLQSQTSIDAAGERFSPNRVKTNVARSLLAVLESECKAYCVLSGYDRLPESFDTDIDFMVDADDFARMPHIIEHVARDTDTKLFHTVEHELSARSYSLGFQSEDTLIIVQPDSTADYRHFGLLWLRASEVLAARRMHPQGFWIPAPAHEFVYYLIKKLNKRSINEEQGLKLHRLYLQDPAGCDAIDCPLLERAKPKDSKPDGFDKQLDKDGDEAGEFPRRTETAF